MDVDQDRIFEKSILSNSDCIIQSTIELRDLPTFFDEVPLIKVIYLMSKENLFEISCEKSLNLGPFSLSVYCTKNTNFLCKIRDKADCENTAGSYSCVCEPGFEQIKAGSDDKYRCKDIDECLDDPCQLQEVSFLA